MRRLVLAKRLSALARYRNIGLAINYSCSAVFTLPAVARTSSRMLRTYNIISKIIMLLDAVASLVVALSVICEVETALCAHRYMLLLFSQLSVHCGKLKLSYPSIVARCCLISLSTTNKCKDFEPLPITPYYQACNPHSSLKRLQTRPTEGTKLRTCVEHL